MRSAIQSLVPMQVSVRANFTKREQSAEWRPFRRGLGCRHPSYVLISRVASRDRPRPNPSARTADSEQRHFEVACKACSLYTPAPNLLFSHSAPRLCVRIRLPRPTHRQAAGQPPLHYLCAQFGLM